MTIKVLASEDIPAIAVLKPADWNDITMPFAFYLKSDYCHAIKVIVDGEIVGVGASISFKDTAWLAHIIVHPEFRNRGIGRAIVRSLIEDLKRTSPSSILLIATELGEPVYRKEGFQKDTEYIFFSGGLVKNYTSLPSELKTYNEKYKQDILSLDEIVSGEDRSVMILDHILSSRLYIRNGNLLGCYIPTLGEGLIIADDLEAGVELMRYKYTLTSRAVLPADNLIGIDFLLQNNYREVQRASRMWLGNKITWHPEKLYSRIGGHVG